MYIHIHIHIHIHIYMYIFKAQLFWALSGPLRRTRVLTRDFLVLPVCYECSSLGSYVMLQIMLNSNPTTGTLQQSAEDQGRYPLS